MALVNDTIMEIGSFLDVESIGKFKLINTEWYQVYMQRFVEIYGKIIVRTQDVELFIKAIRYRPDIVEFVLSSPLCGYNLLKQCTMYEWKCYPDRTSKEYSGTALHAACRYNFESFKLILNSKWCTSKLVETSSKYYVYSDDYGVVLSGTVLNLACCKNIPAALYLIHSKFNTKKLLTCKQTSEYHSDGDVTVTYKSCLELAEESNNKELIQALL